jgi:5'-3' exoribonuclease 2
LTQPAPETEEEMMLEIFNYTERVVNMIRPRKLLFMAIGAAFHCDVVHAINADSITDGVAPRAKMNQQRSRRFRTAQEAKEKEVARTEAVAMWEGLSNYLQRGRFLIFCSS